jgi:hypothetical protein
MATDKDNPDAVGPCRPIGAPLRCRPPAPIPRRISITPAAFEAIAAMLPLGSVAFEREVA